MVAIAQQPEDVRICEATFCYAGKYHVCCNFSNSTQSKSEDTRRRSPQYDDGSWGISVVE